jgi:hypothetical protein
MHPERTLLADFRASDDVANAEADALAVAARVLTPSAYVAEIFGSRAVKLPWSMPPRAHFSSGDWIAFPGPTAARKGAYEVREAARRLGLTVSLSGRELEGADFWQGVSTVRPTTWLEGCRAVVLPAVVEDQPRKLLEAVASGVPVIATEACGLGPMEGVITVPSDDVDALVAAIQSVGS